MEATIEKDAGAKVQALRKKLKGQPAPRRHDVLRSYLLGSSMLAGENVYDVVELSAALPDDIGVDMLLAVLRHRVNQLLTRELTLNQLTGWMDELAFVRGGHVLPADLDEHMIIEIKQMLDGTQPESKSSIIS
jgi:hypothetical protein